MHLFEVIERYVDDTFYLMAYFSGSTQLDLYSVLTIVDK